MSDLIIIAPLEAIKNIRYLAAGQQHYVLIIHYHFGRLELQKTKPKSRN